MDTFLEKYNLPKLTEEEAENLNLSLIHIWRCRRGETTTDTTEIQRIVENYYEELYVKKFENLGEMDKYLENYNLPKWNEEAESLNRPITPDEIEAVIKKILAQKNPGLDSFTEEFYKAFKEELTPILHKLFQKFNNREDSETLFMNLASSLSPN